MQYDHRTTSCFSYIVFFICCMFECSCHVLYQMLLFFRLQTLHVYRFSVIPGYLNTTGCYQNTSTSSFDSVVSDVTLCDQLYIGQTQFMQPGLLTCDVLYVKVVRLNIYQIYVFWVIHVHLRIIYLLINYKKQKRPELTACKFILDHKLTWYLE